MPRRTDRCSCGRGPVQRRSSCRVAFQPAVALLFELQRQLLAAGLHQPAIAQHVHEVGHDVIEQPLVVRHDDDRAIGPAHGVDAFGDSLQGVDVEARIGLVENRELRLQHGHLQYLVALLPAAWEAAELAAARIVFDGSEYKSQNFLAMGGAQRADFTAAGGKHGLVEITYPETGADQPKLSFLAEERNLLDSLTEMLMLHLDRKEARDRIEGITKELIERNKELWSLQQEMGRVEQRAALGWMTGAIAHELGTPLNSVLGYTQLLAQEELSEKAQRHVKTITGQVQRMTGIVQYYLDRTRGSTSKRSRVNINELINETLLLLASVFAEKQIQAVTHLGESLPAINAHAGSLQRVLINLLNNALASIRDQGEITIATRSAAPPELPRPGIIIEIIDTGVGIPADLLPRIFDLFMTTRPDDNGTGLGLAVSQEIVKEHGGKITISSQVGRGTTVTVFLPTNVDRSERL